MMQHGIESTNKTKPSASIFLQLLLIFNLLFQIYSRFTILPQRKIILASFSVFLFFICLWEFRYYLVWHDFLIGLVLLYCLLYYRFVSQRGYVGMLSSLPFLLIGYVTGILFRYSTWKRLTFIFYLVLAISPFLYGFWIRKINVSNGMFFLMNRNTISALLIPAVSLQVLNEELKQKPYIIMFPSIFVLIISYYSMSRTGLLLSVLLLGFLIVYNIIHGYHSWVDKHNPKIIYRLLFSIGIVIAFLIIVMIMNYLFEHSRLISDGFSSNGRLTIYQQFFSEMNLKNFLFGFRPTITATTSIHNSYLSMISLFGIVSVVFFSIILFALWRFIRTSWIKFGLLLIWCLYSLVESISPLDMGDFILIPLLMLAYPPKKLDIPIFPRSKKTIAGQ